VTVKVEVRDDAYAVAGAAAEFVATLARAAVAAHGRFTVAVSGGRTPWLMLRAFSRLDLPWAGVHVFQVDERVAPAGDPERNFTHLVGSLLASGPLPPGQCHAMPVELADLAAAAASYSKTLRALAGSPPVLDLVHLGLGDDGHTASLVPGDPALSVADADVALAGPYQGRRRMTLTFPAINRARAILWLVTGAEKRAMLARLVSGNPAIPAGRVRQERAVVFADRAAAPGAVSACAR